MTRVTMTRKVMGLPGLMELGQSYEVSDEYAKSLNEFGYADIELPAEPAELPAALREEK